MGKRTQGQDDEQDDYVALHGVYTDWPPGRNEVEDGDQVVDIEVVSRHRKYRYCERGDDVQSSIKMEQEGAVVRD